MGLLSFASGVLGAGLRAVGLGGATTVGTGAARAGLLAGVGRAIASPNLLATFGAGAAGGALGTLFGGGGATPSGIAPGIGGTQFAPTGLQRSTFVTLDNGARILVSPNGRASIPQIFIPAGARMPPGHTLVFIGPNGDLFGLRRRRKKRSSFAVRVSQTKDLIRDAKALIKAVK